MNKYLLTYLSHMNLEERVVAAEVASRRADGPGVIEVQSQRR
eukprot:SAG11_NODE_18764_length_481_cov_26.413613_1_plen_41_part_01